MLADIALDHSLVDAPWAAAFTAFLSAIGWLVSRGFDRLDKRHSRAEDKLEKQDERLNDHETRISVLEKFDNYDR